MRITIQIDDTYYTLCQELENTKAEVKKQELDADVEAQLSEMQKHIDEMKLGIE